MKAYKYGRQKEYWVRNFLRKRGYIVIRSAGSHTLFDIVAVHPEKGIVRLIQVKALKSKKWIKEKKDITELGKNNKYDYIKYELWVYDRQYMEWDIFSNGEWKWKIKRGKIHPASITGEVERFD